MVSTLRPLGKWVLVQTDMFHEGDIVIRGAGEDVNVPGLESGASVIVRPDVQMHEAHKENGVIIYVIHQNDIVALIER